MFRSKSSSIDIDLFKISDDCLPINNLEKMNSWNNNPLLKKKIKKDSTQKNKKSKYIKLKNKINLRKIYIDFITTEFDKKLENNIKYMKNSSIKLLSLLNDNSKKDNIIHYTDNAVTNLLFLILSDSKNIYTTKRMVKYNIHFYLKLAEKASNNGDHQTAILILIVLDNYSITRLELEYNKCDKKIIEKLKTKYGNFDNCYENHMKDIIDNYDLNNIDINNNYLPSSLLLYIYGYCIGNTNEIYRRLGKFPRYNKYGQNYNGDNNYNSELINYRNKENIIEINEKIGNKFNKDLYGKKHIKLAILYKRNVKEKKLVKELLLRQINTDNLSTMLFNLSCKVKNIKKNKQSFDLYKDEIKKRSRIYYCK